MQVSRKIVVRAVVVVLIVAVVLLISKILFDTVNEVGQSAGQGGRGSDNAGVRLRVPRGVPLGKDGDGRVTTPVVVTPHPER